MRKPYRLFFDIDKPDRDAEGNEIKLDIQQIINIIRDMISVQNTHCNLIHYVFRCTKYQNRYWIYFNVAMYLKHMELIVINLKKILGHPQKDKTIDLQVYSNSRKLRLPLSYKINKKTGVLEDWFYVLCDEYFNRLSYEETFNNLHYSFINYTDGLHTFKEPLILDTDLRYLYQKSPVMTLENFDCI